MIPNVICAVPPAVSFWSWVGDKVIGPAVVALVFSSVTPIALERFRGRRDATSKIVEGLRDDLRYVRDIATEYWSRPGKSDDLVLEAKIISAQSEIGSTLALLDHILEAPNTSAKIGDFFDALTGGQFQTSERIADPVRIQRIGALTSELRFRVVQARIRSLTRARGR